MSSTFLGGPLPPTDYVAQQSIAAGANDVGASGSATALDTLLKVSGDPNKLTENERSIAGAIGYLNQQQQLRQQQEQQQREAFMRNQAIVGGGGDAGSGGDTGGDTGSDMSGQADANASANSGEDGSPGSGADGGDAGDGDGSYARGGLVGYYGGGGQVIPLAGGGKVAMGPGGGLDDLIPTTINGRQAAALSDGEFVFPADVVSMMGDGSTNEGSRRLYDLIKSIREAKTGTSQQAGPLPVAKLLSRAT